MSLDDQLPQAVRKIDALVPDARHGLPDALFYLVSRLTPLVNVDLWIERPSQGVLLTWRDDRFYSGWHVPGGIIRFKETAADRIGAVARMELGSSVDPCPTLLEVHEIRSPERDIRGHFIAMLYRTRLTSPPDPALACTDPDRPLHGQWAWHASYPERMIQQQTIYRHLFPA